MDQQPIITPAPKSSAMPVITGVIVAALVALIAGASVYAYEKQQNTTDQNNLQAQINSLKTQLAAAAKATPTATATPVVSFTPTATPAVSPTANPNLQVLTASAIGNATITLNGTDYKLTNGKYTHPGTGPFGPGTIDAISLDASNIAINTGIPSDVAAVTATVTEEYPGAMGAGTYKQLMVFANMDGRAVYWAGTSASELGAQAATVSGLTFVDHTVTATVTVGGKATTTRYTFGDDHTLKAQ